MRVCVGIGHMIYYIYMHSLSGAWAISPEMRSQSLYMLFWYSMLTGHVHNITHRIFSPTSYAVHNTLRAQHPVKDSVIVAFFFFFVMLLMPQQRVIAERNREIVRSLCQWPHHRFTCPHVNNSITSTSSRSTHQKQNEHRYRALGTQFSHI